MSISDQVEKVKEALRRGDYTSEAAVSQGIVLPMFHGLGWPIFEPTVVVPEYSVEGRRVDFALCHPAKHPAVFVEVKKVGFTEGADRQLFEYAFFVGVPMAILTDGQEWSFYLPAEQGRFDERRVYKVDLLERTTEESVERLIRYLDYGRTCSGEALKAARSDYKNVARDREIDRTFAKAWASLLEARDSLLLEMLAEKVEDLCGYKPDLDTCGQFIEIYAKGTISKSAEPSRLPVQRTKRSKTRMTGNFNFTFKGEEHSAGSARDVMIRIFQLLAEEDLAFLERFAARKHGRKRRYVARDKRELYPNRPDLAEGQSAQIIPGWWIGTNYSRRDIKKIINLACEVAGCTIKVDFD